MFSMWRGLIPSWCVKPGIDFSIPGNSEWLLELKVVIFSLAEGYVPARFDKVPTGTRESFWPSAE